MTKYLSSQPFSVGGGGGKYEDGWERTFGKKNEDPVKTFDDWYAAAREPCPDDCPFPFPEPIGIGHLEASEPSAEHMKLRLNQIIEIVESGVDAERGYGVVTRLAWNAVSPHNSPFYPSDEELIEECRKARDE